MLETTAEEIQSDVKEKVEPVVTNAERLNEQIERTNGYIQRKIDDTVNTRHKKAKTVVERLKKLDAIEDEDEVASEEIEELPPA